MRKDGKMAREIEIRKCSIEEQVADLQVRVACLEVSRIAEVIKAQASWIDNLEERVKRLEKELGKEVKNERI